MKIKIGPTAFTAIIIGVVIAASIAWAALGGPVVTNDATGTAKPQQLGKNPGSGKVLALPTGTDISGAYWTTVETGLPPGEVGQIPVIVALTATRTVVTTGSQTSVGTQTYSYTQSATGTSTVTQTVTTTTTATGTVTGATGTYTLTATGTSTGLYTSGEVTTQAFPRGLSLYGNVLYVAARDANKMQTVNVSNPASMSIGATYNSCGTPRDVVAWGSSVAIGCGDNHAHLWDCSAGLAACTNTYDYTGVDDAAQTISAFGWGASNYALIANAADNNVELINLSTGVVSGKTSTITGCTPFGVSALSASRAMVACSGNGRVYVVDYSTPLSPSTQGYVSTTTPNGLYSWGGRYTAVADYGGNTIHIVDSNDPNNPTIIGAVSTGASTGPRMITGYGAFLYATMFDSGELKVISVADLTSPAVVGTISVGSAPIGVASNGAWAFVALSTGNKIISVNVSRFQTTSGTHTTTNTMTATGTVTNTMTQTGTATNTSSTGATATQTVNGTSIYTSSATGTGTSVGTGWKAEGANRYDPAGTFFLNSISGEGSEIPVYLRWGELQEGGAPHAYSATCSTGSDGLIATIEPMSSQLISRRMMISGWWRAELLAHVNANAAAIRVETWTHDSPGSDMKLFDWTTDVFSNTYPDTVVKEKFRTADDTTTSKGPLGIFFKLYATCSTTTTVTLELGYDWFPSRILSPYLGDRILASEVQLDGYPGYSAKSVLDDFTASRRTADKFMIPAAQFEYISVAPYVTLGTAPNILKVITLHDGATEYASAALVTMPSHLVGSSVSVVPVWAPVVTDTWSFAKIRWSLTHKVLQHYPTPVDVTSAGTTTVWSGAYCSNNCIANYVQEYDGNTITGINGGDTVMFSIARVGADAADTFVGDINLIGLRIEYAASL